MQLFGMRWKGFAAHVIVRHQKQVSPVLREREVAGLSHIIPPVKCAPRIAQDKTPTRPTGAVCCNALETAAQQGAPSSITRAPRKSLKTICVVLLLDPTVAEKGGGTPRIKFVMIAICLNRSGRPKEEIIYVIKRDR
jgi:hypothetical protein